MKSFFVARKKFQKSGFWGDLSRKKGFKESLFRHFTALIGVFMYTPIHIYMYSRPQDQQQWKLYFPNCVHSADAIEKLLFLHRSIHIRISAYKNNNFLLQDFQRLNYLCRTTKTVLTPKFVILLQITGLNPTFIYVWCFYYQ